MTGKKLALPHVLHPLLFPRVTVSAWIPSSHSFRSQGPTPTPCPFFSFSRTYCLARISCSMQLAAPIHASTPQMFTLCGERLSPADRPGFHPCGPPPPAASPVSPTGIGAISSLCPNLPPSASVSLSVNAPLVSSSRRSWGRWYLGKRGEGSMYKPILVMTPCGGTCVHCLKSYRK